MARSTQARYASRAVSGTSAYDLRYVARYGSAVPAEEPRRQPQRRPRRAPQRRPQTRPAVKAAPKAAQRRRKGYGVSLFAVFGFMTAAVLIEFVLLLQVRYEAVRAEAAALQSELKDLTELERRLRIQYEDAFDVTRVEEYATTVLGMTKPAVSGGAAALQAPAEDRALVVTAEEEPEREGGLAAFLSSVMAYFKHGS